ncbi:MAG: 16S rRNA (cytosine(1402)-N(4))-methyltransferase RsmH [Fimbriimonadaceae bacterium]
MTVMADRGFSSEQQAEHLPVMVEEVLEYLAPKPLETLFDGTLGLCGHSLAVAQVVGTGFRLYATDWDGTMLARAEEILKQEGILATLWNEDYKLAAELLEESGVQPDLILLDLGVCSLHLDEADRGFSFQADAPLDMRMNRRDLEPAAALLNRWSAIQIQEVLSEYGGERFARRIAEEIVSRRKVQPLKTTGDLVDCVLAAVPMKFRDKRIHPATRTFQAVRIAVNHELDDLEEAIAALARRLNEGGRMVVLSYHSGEDAPVKRAFRDLGETGEFELLTKKPVTPTEQEKSANPRSRSAKLRAIRRRTAN